MNAAIEQSVLREATVEEIEALTADDVRELISDETAIITKPKLANLKRYALKIHEQNRHDLIKQSFADQFGGKRAWLKDNYPDCEFEIEEDNGKPCVKIYPEGK